MQERWKLLRAQDQSSRDNLPDAAGSNALAKRWFGRINHGFWRGLQNGCAFRRIDKCSVRAANDHASLWFRQFRENLGCAFRGGLPHAEIASGLDLIDRDRTLTAKKDRTRSFAQDGSASGFPKRLDRRLGANKPPLAIRVEKDPVCFLRANNEAVIESVTPQQIIGHLYGQYTHCTVANSSIASARHSQDCREMARRRIKNGLRKKKGTRRVGACLHDVVIKAFCVSKAAAC